MNLSERDRNLIWHPFTQQQTASLNIAIVRGNGILLYDCLRLLNSAIDLSISALLTVRIGDKFISLYCCSHPVLKNSTCLIKSKLGIK